MAARPSAQLPDTKDTRIQVPQWDLDPVSSLKCWPLLVDMGTREVEIPAMSAAEWLSILMAESLSLDDLLDLIPNWEEILLEEDLTMEEVHDLCTEIITAASARKWWITLRLVHLAQVSWNVLGPGMTTQVDADKVSLSAWLGVLTITTLQQVDEKNRTLLVSRIELPPEGEETPVEEMEMSASAFLALGR